MDPVTIFDDEFVKLSFNWALCLKQIFFIGMILSVLVFINIVTSGFHQVSRPDESNYISGKLDKDTLDFMSRKDELAQIRREEQEKEQQRRDREL